MTLWPRDILRRVTSRRHTIILSGVGITSTGVALPCRTFGLPGDDPRYIAWEDVGRRYGTGATRQEAVDELAEMVLWHIETLCEYEHRMSWRMHEDLRGYERFAVVDRAAVLAAIEPEQEAA